MVLLGHKLHNPGGLSEGVEGVQHEPWLVSCGQEVPDWGRSMLSIFMFRGRGTGSGLSQHHMLVFDLVVRL